jgi:DHA1 family bicyclomycin/chloramphenicol resistance-like MFS transporter
MRVSVGVKTTEPKTAGIAFLVMLGTLTMLPPLSIDVSLPGLPTIAAALNAPPALLPWTLSAFVLAFGLGQLILGPLSDRIGRRPVLIGGMIVFTLAGLGCALVSDVRVLIALRLIQGFGACAGTVCARAVAQDISNDRAGATFRQAVLSAVNSIAPVIAPLIGAAILVTLGWRSLYGVLAVIGVGLVLMVTFFLPETSPRVSGAIATAYARVLRLPRTIGLAILVSMSFFGYFALITGSPFALINQLHVDSTQFALAFAVNATTFLIGAALAGRLAHSIDPERVIAIGAALSLIAGLSAWGVDTFAPSIAGFVATWALYALGSAFVFPGSFAAVLSASRADAGLAAGLLGCLQMIAGAAGSALSGVLPGLPTEELGILALAGGALAAIGYAFSKPALGQHLELAEAAADDR